MAFVLWTLAAVFVAGLVLDLIVARARRRRIRDQQDISPRWLNENTYERDGDDRWK